MRVCVCCVRESSDEVLTAIKVADGRDLRGHAAVTDFLAPHCVTRNIFGGSYICIERERERERGVAHGDAREDSD